MKAEIVELPGLPVSLEDIPGGLEDENGWTWIGLGVPEGWDENPEVRLVTEERAQGDGDFAALARYHTSRRYVVHGAVRTPTWEELEAAEDLVKRVLGDGAPARMVVTRAGSARYVTVLRAAVPYVERAHADTIVRFEIELYAPDPRKYGGEQVITIKL